MIFLIDIDSNDPFDDYQVLKKELHMYDPYMDKKKHLIVLSKLDTIPQEEREETIELLKKEFEKKSHENIIPISSVSGENIKKLTRALYDMIKLEESEVE